MGPKPRDFQTFLRREGACLVWTGVTVKSNGSEAHRYGRITRSGKKHLAHRVAYERAFGPIPVGMMVCHTCDNTLCCEPSHLFLGTQRDNVQDAIRKGRFRGPDNLPKWRK